MTEHLLFISRSIYFSYLAAFSEVKGQGSRHATNKLVINKLVSKNIVSKNIVSKKIYLFYKKKLDR